MDSNIQLENLRKEFAAILTLYNDIIIKKMAMDTKISGIKDTYNDLVKKNPVKTLLFCLDSLFFQYKILNLESEHYNKKMSLLQNRMYGDYYKLYILMISQIKDLGIVLGGEGGEAAQPAQSSQPAQPPQELPIYKDIDPFYKYKIEDITTIHNRILDVLGELYKIYNTKTDNIKKHRDGIAVGESILIFINAMEYEKSSLMGHIQLFSQYLEFYHQSQARYLDCIYRAILDFCANLEDSVLVSIENAQGEALAEPYPKLCNKNTGTDPSTSTNPDTSTSTNTNTGTSTSTNPDITLKIEDIYKGNPNSQNNSALNLENEENEENDTVGPYLNLQLLGSRKLDDNNASSTGTIVYIESEESGEPVGEDYIPQHDNMEEGEVGEEGKGGEENKEDPHIDMYIENTDTDTNTPENITMEICEDTREPPTDNENIPII